MATPMRRETNAAAPAPAPSHTERIAGELRKEILSGRYRAGDRLPSERELAERFDTHRGAVREALKKLEQLGIAQIRPGGARAAPIQEASLDVVQHLLDLENPPDPDLFDQVFEVFSGLFSLSARLGVERADQAQRARALEIVDQLQGDELPIGAVHERIHALSDLFVEASGNMVLAMVRKGVKTRFIDRHEALLAPPSPERPELLERLARAIADGDGPAAANAIFDITQVVRQGAVESLRAEREQLAEPSKAGAATR